jgi:hypothetical protein
VIMDGAFFEDVLLLLLLPKRPPPFLPPSLGVEDDRSRLESFLSWAEPNAPFHRRPGETLLFFPPRSSGTPNVEFG